MIAEDAASWGLAFRRELALLLDRRWLVMLACLAAQYVHGVATQLAFARHVAGPPLRDIGFILLPPLPAGWRWVSEALFGLLFGCFVCWSLAPLLWPNLAARRRRGGASVVILWTRLLVVLVVCQALRVVSFTATSLPGPAAHCALGVARPPVLRPWWRALIVDVRRQVAHSCGDLIFSSHLTFLLLGALAFQHYERDDDDNNENGDGDGDGEDGICNGSDVSSSCGGGVSGRRRQQRRRFGGAVAAAKAAAWLGVAASALLIVAARKHYSVDVVVACYAVPLAFHALHARWELQRRAGAACSACSVFVGAAPPSPLALSLGNGGGGGGGGYRGGCCAGCGRAPSGTSKQQQQQHNAGRRTHKAGHQLPADVEAQVLVLK